MTVPNRFTGVGVRSAAQLMANFDDVEAAAAAPRDLLTGGVGGRAWTSGNWYFGPGGLYQDGITNIATIVRYINANDWVVGTGTRTPKFQMRGWCASNNVDPGINFVVKLFAITGLAGPSGVGNTWSGTPVVASALAAMTPGAAGSPIVQGPTFTLTPNLYALGVTPSGNAAAASRVDVGATLFTFLGP